jgi:hypothetical protein
MSGSMSGSQNLPQLRVTSVKESASGGSCPQQ